tara:strand:+ start:277 stop:474 length:198 start_codon:yes stop_codon:yes gene_type:complete
LINRFIIYVFLPKIILKKSFYKLLAKLNKAILPSFSKQRLDLAKASKLQMALIGWRYFITTKALD